MFWPGPDLFLLVNAKVLCRCNNRTMCRIAFPEGGSALQETSWRKIFKGLNPASIVSSGDALRLSSHQVVCPRQGARPRKAELSLFMDFSQLSVTMNRRVRLLPILFAAVLAVYPGSDTAFAQETTDASLEVFLDCCWQVQFVAFANSCLG